MQLKIIFYIKIHFRSEKINTVMNAFKNAQYTFFNSHAMSFIAARFYISSQRKVSIKPSKFIYRIWHHL